MRMKTGSSPLQVLTAIGTGRPAIRSDAAAFRERAPSWSRSVARGGRIDSRRASEKTRPPAGRFDWAMRLETGSGMEALSFRVEEDLRHDRRLALRVEIVDGDLSAETGAPAAQQGERDGLADRGRMRG